jgi:glycosyltransferase involved in cell wall biosynthesis
LHYAGLVAGTFGDTHEVILALPQTIEKEPQVAALSNRTFKVHFYPFQGETESVIGMLDSLWRAFGAWKCLMQLIKHHEPDLVAIPTGDGLAVVAGLLNIFPLPIFRKSRIDICVMRGPQCYPEQPFKQMISNIKWWLVCRGPWQRVMMMDPREWARASNTIRRNVILCPDPVPEQKYFDQKLCRELLNLPTDGRIVVSVGPQNRRKGSDFLLEGFAAADLNYDDRLVMIGRIDPVIAPLIESLKLQPEFDERLIVRDEFVSEDEFQMAIVASDVVAIPYRSVDRPSGIVCRSMAWNRPLVMTNRGWLKWILNKFSAGFGTAPNVPSELGKTIRQALDQSTQFQHTCSAREFIKFNTEASFLSVWRCGIDFHANSEVQDVSFLTDQFEN